MSELRFSSFSPMNHLEPRPPPRLSHSPAVSPLDMMATPRPTVPDVSLIFDSSGFGSGSGSMSTLRHPTPRRVAETTDTALKTDRETALIAANSKKNEAYTRNVRPSRQSTSPVSDSNEGHSDSNLSRHTPLMHNCNSSNDLKLLISMISKHEAYMVRMESQIKDLVDFQNNFLANLIKRGSSLHKEVQTDRDDDCCSGIGDRNSLSGASSCSSESFQSLPKADSIRKKPIDNSQLRLTEENQPSLRNGTRPSKQFSVGSSSSINLNKEKEIQRPGSSESNRTNGPEKTEDLSAILRDLHLPSVQDNSMYSDASIRLLDLQEYHDDSINSNNDTGSPQIGPSVSAYGSYSSDDENSPPAVKPTVTFYRNVLGNVNRLLENDGNNEAQENVQPSPRVYNRGTQRNLNSKRSVAVRNASGNLQLTSSSGESSYSSDRTNNGASKERHQEVKNVKGKSNDVGDVTKRYLENLGVQFTPTNEKQTSRNPKGNQANFMIQQNVYNSIFIPTLNCVPVGPESLGSTSGQFNDLANKYIPQEDLHQYKAVQESQRVGVNSTDTTMYGMTSNHLSFATKQYLQRYGLVNQANPSCERVEEPLPPPPTRPRNMQYTKFFNEPVNQSTDRILDLTALRNQPKLM